MHSDLDPEITLTPAAVLYPLGTHDDALKGYRELKMWAPLHLSPESVSGALCIRQRGVDAWANPPSPLLCILAQQPIWQAQFRILLAPDDLLVDNSRNEAILNDLTQICPPVGASWWFTDGRQADPHAIPAYIHAAWCHQELRKWQQQGGKDIPEILRRAAWASLPSKICPACNNVKKAHQSYCGSCYRSLPQDTRQRLYTTGPGYVHEWVEHLPQVICPE